MAVVAMAAFFFAGLVVIDSVSAQHLIGSRPLAVRTPTVGLVPPGTRVGPHPNSVASYVGYSSRGYGHRSRHVGYGHYGYRHTGYRYTGYGHRHYHRHYYPRGHYGFYYHRPRYYSGFSVSVGVGYGYRGGYFGVAYPVYSGCYVPISYGYYRYGYGPYGYGSIYSPYYTTRVTNVRPVLNSPLIDPLAADRARAAREALERGAVDRGAAAGDGAAGDGAAGDGAAGDGAGVPVLPPAPADLPPVPRDAAPLPPPPEDEPRTISDDEIPADRIVADYSRLGYVPVRATSNVASMRTALRLIRSGDALFQQRRYREAGAQYRSATRAAPDFSEAYFRQAFALIAAGSFDRAGELIAEGTMVDAAFIDSGFELNSLYESEDQKESHLEALATAALRDPTATEFLVMVGVFLHFDNQSPRAQRFFRRAVELDPQLVTLVAHYMNGNQPLRLIGPADADGRDSEAAPDRDGVDRSGEESGIPADRVVVASRLP